MDLWDWIEKNKDQLTVLIAIVPVTWAAIQFLWAKKQEIKHRRFETYHGLIKSLVEGEDPSQPLRLDRQIAVIYELRNYKSYFPVSLRILKGLKDSWSSYSPEDCRSRLHAELDESIRYIARRI